MLAGELRLHGVHVVVLEKETEPSEHARGLGYLVGCPGGSDLPPAELGYCRWTGGRTSGVYGQRTPAMERTSCCTCCPELVWSTR